MTAIFKSITSHLVWKQVASGHYQNSYVHNWIRVTKRAISLLDGEKVPDRVADLMERYDSSLPALLPRARNLALRNHWEDFHHQRSHPVKQKKLRVVGPSWEPFTRCVKAFKLTSCCTVQFWMFHKPQMFCLSILKCVYNLVKKEMFVVYKALPVNVIALVTPF